MQRNIIQVIKKVREANGMELKQAKGLVELFEPTQSDFDDFWVARALQPQSDFDKQCELAALETEVHGMDAHNAHQTAIGESSMYEQSAYERIAEQMRSLKEG